MGRNNKTLVTQFASNDYRKVHRTTGISHNTDLINVTSCWNNCSIYQLVNPNPVCYNKIFPWELEDCLPSWPVFLGPPLRHIYNKIIYILFFSILSSIFSTTFHFLLPFVLIALVIVHLPFLHLSLLTSTRGHNYKLVKPVCKNNARQFSFACRLINSCNIYPLTL